MCSVFLITFFRMGTYVYLISEIFDRELATVLRMEQ